MSLQVNFPKEEKVQNLKEKIYMGLAGAFGVACLSLALYATHQKNEKEQKEAAASEQKYRSGVTLTGGVTAKKIDVAEASTLRDIYALPSGTYQLTSDKNKAFGNCKADVTLDSYVSGSSKNGSTTTTVKRVVLYDCH